MYACTICNHKINLHTPSFLAEASVPELFTALASAFAASDESGEENGLARQKRVKHEAHDDSDDDRGKPRRRRERKEPTRQDYFCMPTSKQAF